MRRALFVLALAASLAGAEGNPDWTPARWTDVDTLQLQTVDPDEGAYDFPVWLVVIDGDVYVRLGRRAANRVQASITHPFVGVTIDGREFPRVRAEPAADQVDAVAAAMAEKYWSDVFIRHLAHPLTLRLRPE